MTVSDVQVMRGMHGPMLSQPQSKHRSPNVPQPARRASGLVGDQAHSTIRPVLAEYEVRTFCERLPAPDRRASCRLTIGVARSRPPVKSESAASMAVAGHCQELFRRLAGSLFGCLFGCHAATGRSALRFGGGRRLPRRLAILSFRCLRFALLSCASFAADGDYAQCGNQETC